MTSKAYEPNEPAVRALVAQPSHSSESEGVRVAAELPREMARRAEARSSHRIGAQSSELSGGCAQCQCVADAASR
jgi:hypothetical protein